MVSQVGGGRRARAGTHTHHRMKNRERVMKGTADVKVRS